HDALHVAMATGVGVTGVGRPLERRDNPMWKDEVIQQIAVAVLIEHGGRAAKVAAPVAMEIFQGYFKYVDRMALRNQGPTTPTGGLP
ncbi:MAG: hypothetical protein ACK2U9_21980, partial [Anaerolineae bacterium]